MIFDETPAFLAALPPMRGLIGLDLGDKTIGVAVSDTFQSVATPIETIRRKKFGLDAARLVSLSTSGRSVGLYWVFRAI